MEALRTRLQQPPAPRPAAAPHHAPPKRAGPSAKSRSHGARQREQSVRKVRERLARIAREGEAVAAAEAARQAEEEDDSLARAHAVLHITQ